MKRYPPLLRWRERRLRDYRPAPRAQAPPGTPWLDIACACVTAAGFGALAFALLWSMFR